MTAAAIAPATPEAISAAAAHLRAGHLVAFPTETVYGLGVDATNAEAIARLYAAKGRPLINPLIVHIALLDEARPLARMSPLAERLAEAFWPGPLTLVCERMPSGPLPLIVSAGLDSVALRVPAHDTARALIAAAGRPIAAPSANRSGRLSPTTAADVAADFPGGEVAMILGGDAARHGLESTIVDVRGAEPLLLRPGALAAEAIAACLGRPVRRAEQDVARPHAPGGLASHYAPRAGVRLDAASAASGEALLAFGPGPRAAHDPTVNLSPKGDLVEAAANLYAALRRLDATGARMIAVEPIPHHGLGEAINDRLARAAAPR
jgi:L-threonylcarbamoyladenylate synthase